MKKGLMFVGLFLILSLSVFVSAEVSDYVKEKAEDRGCFIDSENEVVYGRDGFLGNFVERKDYCVNLDRTESNFDENAELVGYSSLLKDNKGSNAVLTYDYNNGGTVVVECEGKNCESAKRDSCSEPNCGVINFGCRDLTPSDVVAYYGTNPLKILSMSLPDGFYISKSVNECDSCNKGVCISESEKLIERNVTCVFQNSPSPQKCFALVSDTFNAPQETHTINANVDDLSGKVGSKMIPRPIWMKSSCGESINFEEKDNILYYTFDCENTPMKETKCLAYDYFDENNNELAEPLAVEVNCIEIPLNFKIVSGMEMEVQEETIVGESLTPSSQNMNLICDGNYCELCEFNIEESCIVYSELKCYPEGSRREGTFSYNPYLPENMICDSETNRFDLPIRMTGESCENRNQCQANHFCIDNECIKEGSLKYIVKNWDRILESWKQILKETNN